MRLRYQHLALAVLLPLIFAFALVTAFTTLQSSTLAVTSIATVERNILHARESEVVNPTNPALSTINDVYDADDERAKRWVGQTLHAMNLGEDGYRPIQGYNGKSIVHPRQSFSPSRHWMDLLDADGDRTIADPASNGETESALLKYRWEKPTSGAMAENVSFAAGPHKWRWTIGAGVYLDDVLAQISTVKADLKQSIRQTFILSTLIAIASLAFVFAICVWITLHERRLAEGKHRLLTQRILDTQEEERSRLSRELHDCISQNLVGVRYALDLASRKVKACAADASAAIDQAIEALNGAIDEVRELSRQLRPRVLDDRGLTAALISLGGHFEERTGIRVSVDSTGTGIDTLKPEASTALYRIAQEALANVERHAGASQITIKMWSTKGRVRLSIADNGHGFSRVVEPGVARSRGMGLRNMQERMAHLRGKLLIQTRDNGTTLTAMLPRSANAAAMPSMKAA